MSNHAVANRYAVALFQVAQEKGTVKQVGSELQLVKDVIAATPAVMDVLNHPKIAVEKKQELIRTSFNEALSETVLQTLYLLIERRRTDILIPFINKFKTLSYEAQNIAEAKVLSAKPLTDEEKKQLSELFARKLGKDELLIENVVEKDLIGGLKIRIGDRIYDGSVKGQLDRLQRELIVGKR
ncbi:F0F1 ATP synthase subunit delta [Halalkalibacterium ligniniphilum]|uniref:F0F1 ATP synthase subunit delta n=1 Tax=Halalkalibacterium ligniniphilum TaxID=1134413 RepID=UPI00034D8600|nr:F0F1 ATP synthase subunit delta [Halalkalibacterium ligniniphilum]